MEFYKIAVVILLCALTTDGQDLYKLLKKSQRQQQAWDRHHRYFEEDETLNTLMSDVNTDDVGVDFDRAFETNRAEYVNHPVKPATPLPSWLRGSLIKNGLGQFEMGPRSVGHAFDAFAKITSVHFHNRTNVTFTTRFLETDYYLDSKKADTITPYLLFAPPEPPFGFLEKYEAIIHGEENNNINILHIRNSTVGGKTTYSMLAITDFWPMYEFNLNTTETMGRIMPDVPVSGHYSDSIPLPSSAHPMKEPGTDNYISFVSRMATMPWQSNTLNVIRLTSKMGRELIASIPMKETPYMHSLGLTDTHAILLAHPLYVDVEQLIKTASPSQSFDWRPNEHTTIFVVNYKSGKVHEIKTNFPPRFNLHVLNCYNETKDKIICDFVTYPDAKFLPSLTVKNLRDKVLRNTINFNGELVRYTIHLNNNTAKASTFPVTPNANFVNSMDMPKINPNFYTKAYCYAYGVVMKTDGIHFARTALVKKNVCTGGQDKAWMMKDVYVSEPQFIPKPNAEREDDGVLLSVVMDGQKMESFVAVLNPGDMTLINKVPLPTHVPYLIHGTFIN